MNARLATAVVVVLGLIAVGCSSADDTAGIEIDDGRVFDVQGHRGARGIRPESTLPSFEAALDAGVSTLELDLHLSSDGQLVVWHDAEISPDKCRTEDTTMPDPVTLPMVRSLTAAELARYECDLNPDPKGRFRHQESEPGEVAAGDYSIVTLPQLFEFVDLYADDSRKTEDQRTNATVVQFNLETKRSSERPETIGDGFDGTNPAEFEQTLAKVIEDWGYESRVIVQSFDHRSIRAFRTIAPDVRLAALTFGDQKPSFRALSESGVSIWSPQYIFGSLSPDIVADAQSFGIKVVPWTVNLEQNVCTIVAVGGDGLITDRPDMVLGDGGWLAGCVTDE
jgi:glycerophosphoryl diester phosphodiesterase